MYEGPDDSWYEVPLWMSNEYEENLEKVIKRREEEMSDFFYIDSQVNLLHD